MNEFEKLGCGINISGDCILRKRKSDYFYELVFAVADNHCVYLTVSDEALKILQKDNKLILVKQDEGE